MMLLPIVLRLLAKFEGIPRKTGLELSLMTRYFLFQIIVCQISIRIFSKLMRLTHPSTDFWLSLYHLELSLLFHNWPRIQLLFHRFLLRICHKHQISSWRKPHRFYFKLLKVLNTCSRYIILQGLSGTAGGFLQAVPLIIYYAKLFILGSTPRSVYSIKYTLRSVAWGTLFPAITLITAISKSA